MYAPIADESAVPHHIIEPVATQFTKGVIVWSTIYGNIVRGRTMGHTCGEANTWGARAMAPCYILL